MISPRPENPHTPLPGFLRPEFGRASTGNHLQDVSGDLPDAVSGCVRIPVPGLPDPAPLHTLPDHAALDPLSRLLLLLL